MTFPTTVAPIVQNRLVPVFVDCEVGTYNINPALIEDAIGPRTRAIFVPHTVGNPCDMAAIGEIAKRRGLWLLEDGCDALGATFNGQLTGTFGAMSSLSFYPAHHITMGEGGGVAINDFGLQKTARSIRDWGRDCWCDPGKSNTCGTRFGWQAGELPCGYDHKYIYSNIGYNLKVTDLQAAIGLAQTDKIDQFVAARRLNFRRIAGGAGGVGAVSDSAEDRSAGQSFALRFPDHGAPGNRSRPAGAVAGGRADRDAPGLRRQYHSAARLPEYREARAWRFARLRHHHAGHVVYWRVPWPDARDDLVCARDVPELLHVGTEVRSAGVAGSDGVAGRAILWSVIPAPEDEYTPQQDGVPVVELRCLQEVSRNFSSTVSMLFNLTPHTI